MVTKLLSSTHLRLLTVCWLGLSLLLAACSDTPPVSQPPATPPSQKGPVPSGQPPVAVPALPQTSNNLPYDCSKYFCFGLSQEPVGLLQGKPEGFDPANLVDRPSLQISRQVYETLFEFKPADMQYQYSSLLKYPPKESEDGLTYTLRIGKGLRFSDDSPLDAAAVKFNFERWSDPGNLYHKGEFETWRGYFGGFPGNLASVQADETNNVVVVKLKQPMGNFYQVLAMPQFGIVAPNAFNRKTGELERAVGSSWYVIDKVVRTESKYVVLRENKNYHTQRFDPADPATPFVKSPVIVAYVLKQNQDGLEELRKGELGATDKIRPEQVAEASKNPAFVLLDRKPLNIAFLGMNHTRAPFNNLAVRQAFAAAIDVRSLVRDYYYGLGQPASVLLPPTTLAHIDLNPPYTYEPDRARRLLDSAGYTTTNPLTLNLWVLPVPRTYYPDPRKIANAIAADLAKVGVILNVKDTKTWPDFRQARQSGGMEFYMFGWQGQNGDPDEFLGEFYGKARGEGGYENPVLQQLVRQGAALTDLRDRRGFYKEAQDIVYAQVPIIPLAYVKGLVVVRPGINGYVANPSGIESWATVEVGGSGQK